MKKIITLVVVILCLSSLVIIVDKFNQYEKRSQKTNITIDNLVMGDLKLSVKIIKENTHFINLKQYK